MARVQNNLLLAEQPTDATDDSSVKETPVFRHFHLLLRNAALASNLIDDMKAANIKPFAYPHPLKFTHMHAMYYLFGKLVLAHRSQDEQFKRALYSTLMVAQPQGTLVARTELIKYLETRHNDHTHLHGMPMHMPGDEEETEYGLRSA